VRGLGIKDLNLFNTWNMEMETRNGQRGLMERNPRIKNRD